jgi:lactobin A/cerein 7B family class IIb bacteriocin
VFVATKRRTGWVLRRAIAQRLKPRRRTRAARALHMRATVDTTNNNVDEETIMRDFETNEIDHEELEQVTGGWCVQAGGSISIGGLWQMLTGNTGQGGFSVTDGSCPGPTPTGH